MPDRHAFNSDDVHHLRRINNPGWVNLDDFRELVASATELDGKTYVYVSGVTKLGEDRYSIRDRSRYSAQSIWVDQVGDRK